MRIFSGIQPTGAKHFGNYSGGFRQYVATQAEGDAFFCIVDLHSISVPHDPAELRSQSLDLAALLFASGLDPELSTVFIQSHVSAHAEAAWLLGSACSEGELHRMTQYKDKAAAQKSVSADLLTYPVLMAGDILLYQTDVVPVGDDQRQHLELTRDIAQRFNARYGDTFRIPAARIPEDGGRVMDLQEPTRKMSTSDPNPAGRLLILDAPDVLRKKIKTAVTDTGREVRRAPDKPGVTNLIDIMSVVSGRSPADIEAEYADSGYGRFKDAVADAVIAALTPVRERALALRDDPAELEHHLRRGAEKARTTSEPTLQAMYDRMGFTPR
ncbi:MAG TPA: tryptophan--tRNA ligase [Candidatus Dormibacteraeota bacterium]